MLCNKENQALHVSNYANNNILCHFALWVMALYFGGILLTVPKIFKIQTRAIRIIVGKRGRDFCRNFFN